MKSFWADSMLRNGGPFYYVLADYKEAFTARCVYEFFDLS
jgi:hypothetical protein